MSKKNLTTFIIILLGVFALYAYWYKNEYSMGKAASSVINDHITNSNILIATQDSEYKNKLVDNLLGSTIMNSTRIEISDISKLKDLQVDGYNAIIIIHTWEMWRAPEVVHNFAARNLDYDNLIVLTTSGGGESTIPTVDGITGASIIENIPSTSEKILSRIKPFLVNAPAIIKETE
ncbi:MAG: hypothetical protein ACI9J3_000187 [Parvicellaceae bacterium]|jgi:hypothetical protein